MDSQNSHVLSFLPGGVTFLLHNRPIRYASIAAGTIYAGLQVFHGHWGLFDYLVPSITVPDSHEQYSDIHDWTSQQFGSTRRLKLRRNDPPRQGPEDRTNTSHASRRKLNYEPFDGKFWFYRSGYLYFFEQTENNGTWPSQYSSKEITFKTIHWSSKPIQHLLQDIIDNSLEKEVRTNIWVPRDPLRFAGIWTRISSKTPRSLESIVLCEEKKRKLLDDIGAFLEPSKRKWYADRGIPWRRGYLFHGPPGTGKTSLALAVAAHYNLPVYIIPLSDRNITDSSIGLFLRSLPSPGLLLMEDIDTAGLVSGVGRQCDGDIKQDGETNGRLTRTGFINALDGPGTPEGILFMMTTNHRENLSDPAMVRPGRIDVELELPLATQDDARQMFINLYRDFARIEELADEFKDKIPHNKYSSAEIQNFLIICKHPQNALQRLSAWLEEGKRVQDRES